MKSCTKCKKIKPKGDFGKHSRNKDGLNAQCTVCIRAYRRFRYHSGCEHVKRAEYAAKYRKEHKDQTKLYQDNYNRASPRRALHIALSRALRRKPSVNAVTIEDLMRMYAAQDGRCLLSGIKLTWGTGEVTGRTRRAKLNSISLDRIDSSMGYERGNVRIICHGLNTMKGPWSDAEMLDLANAFVDHQRRGWRCVA